MGVSRKKRMASVPKVVRKMEKPENICPAVLCLSSSLAM